VQALAGSSVNTVIVTRACVSVFVALLDAIFLRMGWPSVHTWVALAAIFAGAVLYALTDKGFSPQSYAWLSIYFFFICAEMVVVKHIVDTVGAVTARARISESTPPRPAFFLTFGKRPLSQVEMTTWERVYHLRNLRSLC
jgi:drug/metabolite transporter (DMT)-like permease